MRDATILVALLVGCGDDRRAAPDAAERPDARTFSPAASHTLYLAADGVTLLPGAHDATENRSPVIDAPLALAPWLDGVPDRTTKLEAIATQIRTAFARYDITVVTQRPATGPYHMVVMTDDSSTTVGLPPGVFATTPSTCNTKPSVVAFEFGYAGAFEDERRNNAVRNAIGMFGDLAAVPLTTTRGDCMCFVAAVCPTPDPCTIGGRGTTIDRSAGCPGDDVTMDEHARFVGVFGRR